MPSARSPSVDWAFTNDLIVYHRLECPFKTGVVFPKNFSLCIRYGSDWKIAEEVESLWSGQGRRAFKLLEELLELRFVYPCICPTYGTRSWGSGFDNSPMQQRRFIFVVVHEVMSDLQNCQNISVNESFPLTECAPAERPNSVTLSLSPPK